LYAGDHLSAQEPRRIKFSKSQNSFYFFQAGKNRDTVRAGQGDLFYLIVSDSLKDRLLIEIENARLEKTTNYSLQRLIYIPGMKYESEFVQAPVNNGRSPDAKFTFVTRVNGSSPGDHSAVRIQVMDRRENKVLLENIFFYR
jgi:hypothetical protein